MEAPPNQLPAAPAGTRTQPLAAQQLLGNLEPGTQAKEWDVVTQESLGSGPGQPLQLKERSPPPPRTAGQF